MSEHGAGPQIPVRKPTIDNHVLYAHHDQACAVCRERHAIMYMNRWVFMPCDTCRADGWQLMRRVGRWPLRRWVAANE